MQSSLRVTDLETKMFDSSFDSIKSAKEVKPEVNFVEKNKSVKRGSPVKPVTEVKVKKGF